MAGDRKNIAYVFKTMRFDPKLITDVEKVLYLTREEDTPKYPSLNNLVVVAITNLVTKERRKLEREGVAWEHIQA